MTKDSVKTFFDNLASSWDSQIIRNDEIINTILNNAGVTKGSEVLDIACGTGVLIPDYLNREVKSVLGVDISDKMLAIAKSKFTQGNIRFICEDAETYPFTDKYDSIVIYNAFPHFPNPEQLIKQLSKALKSEGILTVAHDMSREKINKHHEGTARSISMGLMEIEELAAIFQKYLTVTTTISNENMYQIAGYR